MSKNSQFEKFINKTKGSVIKEQVKQEKKLAKKQRAEAIEKRFEEKRAMRNSKFEVRGSEVKNQNPKSSAGNRNVGAGLAPAPAHTEAKIKNSAFKVPNRQVGAKSKEPKEKAFRLLQQSSSQHPMIKNRETNT